MKHIKKGLVALRLNLTPEQEKLSKEILARDGQTPEEAFMSFIYLKNEDNNRTHYSRLMQNSHVQKVYADVNENGVLIIPEDAPEHVKDWIRNG